MRGKERERDQRESDFDRTRQKDWEINNVQTEREKEKDTREKDMDGERERGVGRENLLCRYNSQSAAVRNSVCTVSKTTIGSISEPLDTGRNDRSRLCSSLQDLQ